MSLSFNKKYLENLFRKKDKATEEDLGPDPLESFIQMALSGHFPLLKKGWTEVFPPFFEEFMKNPSSTERISETIKKLKNHYCVDAQIVFFQSIPKKDQALVAFYLLTEAERRSTKTSLNFH